MFLKNNENFELFVKFHLLELLKFFNSTGKSFKFYFVFEMKLLYYWCEISRNCSRISVVNNKVSDHNVKDQYNDFHFTSKIQCVH